VALHVLPARQRAALILRDVVGFSAEETAAILETTVAATNSALQRARTALEDHPRLRTAPADGEATAAVASRYVQAWESGDSSRLIALLRPGATLAMAARAMWISGRDAIAGFLAAAVWPAGPIRSLVCSANGCPAVASYQRARDRFELVALSVLELDGASIA